MLFRDGLVRFCTNRDGNFATIFALSVVPVVMVGGMGIDYGTNIAVRQKAQNAVDATVLTLAKLSTTTSDQDLQAKAETQVKALLSDRRLRNPVVTAKRDGDTIWVGILGNTPTSLTSIAGFSQMPVDVSAVVRRGSGNLEVALVLDNTGSMKGAKLANLKSAATSLVESMFREADPAKPNALKMAVVPFSMTVNVGSSYGNAGFMDVDAKSSIHKEIFAVKDATANRFSLFGKMKVAWAGCVETRPTPYDVQESPPTAAIPDTLYIPYFAPDESDNDNSAINDYMSDYPIGTRNQSSNNRTRQGQTAKYGSNRITTSSYDTQSGTGYRYGPNAGCEIQPLTRLTTTKATITDAVTAMTVIGDTNIATGLAWGWHVLSPNAPFADGAPYTDAKTRKYVVLMTDGQNQSAPSSSDNQSYYSGIGFIWNNRIGTTSSDNGTRTRYMDARTAQLCTNMKNAGIQIFTVRVEVNSGTSDMLRNCATSPDMFYDVQNSSALNDVFASIGSQINELRIAR
ncbi:Flp pilus assembly protein TadG [Methylobacterium sp. 190mf]|uniref:TadE/TadG family type IV pilus assembly protein n=1 Tax=Methylobacterium sp. 190mf TaxID=1761798 RepID=UPI00089E8AC5|nr:TadE/TadG family type IV pilus assembly protein [Methylobacterium sp. 190mf]SEG70257.1 Flp pilus assembly protein TadG [Methylobacterium sp. 190mf]